MNYKMSMKRIRIGISIPTYINTYLHEVMGEMGSNKSDLIEAFILFGSQNEDDFKSQYGEAEEVDEEDILDDEEEEE